MAPSLTLVGAYGSPYSRKMRAVLRCRRLAFRWIVRGSREDVGIPAVPVDLIPVLVFPGAGGAAGEAMIDSSFQILHLEKLARERSIVPPDPAVAFLDHLLEDYGDEWLTKAMFHYRWAFPADVARASRVLPLDRQIDLDPAAHERFAKMFAERQIGRLAVVGSSPETAPIIEASYRRLLASLDALLRERPFLFGRRPARGDFGLYGQLTQLAQFDPTPSAVAADVAPRVIAWVSHVDDLSSLEVGDGDWLDRDAVASPALRGLLREVGRTYAPFLVANAAAIAAGVSEVRCAIDGGELRQKPFPYQAKCLRWLREARAGLAAADREWVDRVLAGTGCEVLFEEGIAR
jgi:glutathione S-transferase